MAFSGFPADALTFYQELEAQNSRAFWLDNKERFAEVVRRPMVELCEELSEYGTFHLFRPYNDQRFAKNRPPYKTHQGAYTESQGGAGFYVQLSANGLMCGTGYYGMAKDQLVRFRTAVDAPASGDEIAAIVAGLGKRYTIGAMSELKTAPRGYPKDHRHIELLRRKGLMMSKDFGVNGWLETRQVAKRVRGVWADAAEMNKWLDANVGPSEEAPEDLFG